MPSIPSTLATPVPSYSTSNRRTSASPGHRAYPWLLAASTALAATFCLMYITKPVIISPQPAGPETEQSAPNVPTASTTATKKGLMPDQHRLPGEKASAPVAIATGSPRAASLPSHASGPFEQTNLRVQHILTAEAPGGHVAKIDLDVPVLYQSRNLRWTADEVAEARELLTHLADYQEKSRQLRLEGAQLLDAWNRLIDHSIPVGQLRADSPTLPTNQQDAADAPRPAGLDTSESIKIQPAAK
jgi:hypothetical protein